MSLPRCFFQPGAAEDSQDPPVCLLLFLEPTVGERVVGARPRGLGGAMLCGAECREGRS